MRLNSRPSVLAAILVQVAAYVAGLPWTGSARHPPDVCITHGTPKCCGGSSATVKEIFVSSWKYVCAVALMSASLIVNTVHARCDLPAE